MINYVQTLIKNGWCFIDGTHYEAPNSDLQSLRRGYLTGLALDSYSNGNRYRAYAQCQYHEPNELNFGNFHAYLQTKAYNPDTGGIVRSYPFINHDVLSNKPFLNIIKSDIEFVKQYGLLGHPTELSIGIHLFRYKATLGSPAYSSPIWLHRDDEDIVFVHLINKSENLIGGDNIISCDMKSIETIFRLENPMDTFVVNHNKLHAITPIAHYGKSGFSFRDIILVTFQKMETAVQNGN